MPTFETSQQFLRDMKSLDGQSLERFRQIVLEQFVPDVESGVFRKSLQVKRVKGISEDRVVFEMKWAHDGRATFEYGEEVRSGVVHVVWRRLGTHSRLNTAPGKKTKIRV